MNAAALRTAVVVALAAIFLMVAGPLAPSLSSAAFTSASTNGGNTVGAAADWTPPVVAIAPPAGALRDISVVTATASDAETGIRTVLLQVQAVGAAAWTSLCTATTVPYSCNWDTRTVADGQYSLRAIATDNSGYATTSATVPAEVRNAISVALADPGDMLRGAAALTTVIDNAAAGAYSVTVEYAPADATSATSWKTACVSAAAPYTCTWSTGSVANGSYDLRTTATRNGVATTSPVIEDVLVDNAAPTVGMTDPGSPLRGTVTLAATAADADSGIARVVIQVATNGTQSWQDACVLTAAPYACRYATTGLANGSYAFRAVATDAAGNAATSATVSGRTVDNSVSSVSMEDPGAYLSGTETLTATANSTANVAGVAIQIAPNGTTAWTTLCTPTAAPFSCAWDSRSVADGLYDLRAVLTDGLGKQTVSAAVTARRVDNRAVRGLDVQTANGGSTPGRLEAGDTMTFTYATQMNPASIASGWNGTATAVTVRLRDGAALSLSGSDDTVDILRANTPVNLGSVNLKGDYIKNGKTSLFNATMTATTATVNGQPVTVVRIALVSLASGGALRTASALSANAMVWTPASAATDLAGTPCANVPVIETGSPDREY